MILVNHLMKILNVRISYETIRRYAIKQNPVLPQTINYNLNYFIQQRSFGDFFRMSDDSDVFNGTLDRYNGITIDTEIAAINLNQFAEQLEKSLQHWRTNEHRTIWFKVDLNHAGIVPILSQQGFDFHHAKPGFVMMYKWLPTDLTANIPQYSHTMIGVGGLVVNDKDQILTISEKHAIIQGSWKLPGGYVEPDEQFIDAAIREVEEETGVQTKFDSLVCMRHATGGGKNLNFGFGCSDLYIVIALKPLRPEANEIVSCDREILHCEWLDFDKYLEHPKVHQMNRLFLQTFIENRATGKHITCKDHIHELLKRKYQVYSVESTQPMP